MTPVVGDRNCMWAIGANEAGYITNKIDHMPNKTDYTLTYQLCP